MPVVSNRVIARSRIGQFIRECEMAGHDTIEKAVERGARLSRDMAPVGREHDPRSIPIRESISSRMFGRTSGHWVATARHAPFQEFGATPHEITAWVRFFWEKMGREWMLPSEYLMRTGYEGADPIQHPGNRPQPFMRPAYEVIAAQIVQIAKGEYPG